LNFHPAVVKLYAVHTLQQNLVIVIVDQVWMILIEDKLAIAETA
jgi:hypothetical protein